MLSAGGDANCGSMPRDVARGAVLQIDISAAVLQFGRTSVGICPDQSSCLYQSQLILIRADSHSIAPSAAMFGTNGSFGTNCNATGQIIRTTRLSCRGAIVRI